MVAAFASSGMRLQGQGFRRVEIFEGSMDDIHKGIEDVMRELQGAFSFGFGMFPELEERMTGEMRRLFRPDASTSERWALLDTIFHPWLPWQAVPFPNAMLQT